MKTIEQHASDCANLYLGRVESHTDHFETLRTVFLKGAETTISDAWHKWPDEMPSHNGRYLVILSDRFDNKKLAIRVFRDKDWIFTVKTDIEYWMEIPQTPIKL